MGSGLGLLNDKSSYEDNFITRIDPRVKLFFSFALLVLIICTRNVFVHLSVVSFMVAGIFMLRVNKKIFLIRGLPAISIAVAVLATQIFLYGHTPIFTVDLFGVTVSGYREGLARGIVLMCRVLAGIATVLFLTLSTSMNKLIYAAGWFRMPGAILEVMMITYRYVFVLFDEFTTVKNAQKIRLGYSSPGESVRSLGNLSGIILLRTVDKSEKLHMAMKSRGYNGQQIKVQYNASFTKSDLLVSLGLTSTLGSILFFCR